jgi:hypothetical protein
VEMPPPQEAGIPDPPSKGHPCMNDIPFLDDNGGNFVFWKFHARMVLDL